MSTDLGVTFTLVYTSPNGIYDFPQYCFGGLGDGSNTYGLWFTADFIPDVDSKPAIGFIPKYSAGLENIGAGTTVILDAFNNVHDLPSITASEDGRVWIQSYDLFPATGICPFITLFKSPGEIDSNYAGPWDLAMVNAFPFVGLQTEISQPVKGYFNTVQANIYDDKRKALYSLIINNFPDASQNMRLYFIISRDNEMTWS